jgi:phenylpropionate dioxygenase-like ring-hydroxylating dioxygenase large terminal subunit
MTGIGMSDAELLYNYWYVAAPAGALARGTMKPVTLLGQQVLLLRDNAGVVSALKDFCPHRGIPLRFGSFDGCEVECCYHGWRFNMTGTCTSIPSLVEEKTDISKIKTGQLPCREQDGLIWVYVAATGSTEAPASEPPAMPIALSGGFKHVDSVLFPCQIDHAVIGLMDPAHGPFVHRAWWWRSARSIHAKAKQFEPIGRGFKMVAHRPSSNSRAYKILGGERTTEIEFQLPGLRREHITIGEHHVLLLTALTPISATETVLHQFMYTTIPLLNFLRPLLIRFFGKPFLQQDLRVVKMQQEGLKPGHPPLLLMGDADAPALWYFRLKKEALAAANEARPFENMLKPKLLKWKS